MGERFATERRARHVVFADAGDALKKLRPSHPLALITNGASCLQREKLASSGLGKYFDVVVVSADVGVGKPNAEIFEYTLSRLASGAERAVMVGDSLARDIDGAAVAGLDGVWLNRLGLPRPADRHDVVEIATLSDLPGVLGELP